MTHGPWCSTLGDSAATCDCGAAERPDPAGCHHAGRYGVCPKERAEALWDARDYEMVHNIRGDRAALILAFRACARDARRMALVEAARLVEEADVYECGSGYLRADDGRATLIAAADAIRELLPPRASSLPASRDPSPSHPAAETVVGRDDPSPRLSKSAVSVSEPPSGDANPGGDR